MSETRATEQRFYPWVVDDHGLSLAVVEVRLDGHVVAPPDRRAALVDLVGDWASAELDLELRADGRILDRVLPEAERETPALALTLVIVLRCERTLVRAQACQLAWTEGELSRGSWVFGAPVTLDRRRFAGRVTLDAHLVRAARSPAPVPGFAVEAGARLASARPWLVQIDPSPAAATGNHLEVQYRSFTRDPAIPPRARAALYRLELDREDPILYLNADHERLRPVLDNKGTTGWRARMRDLLFERISAGVWSQLVLAAATQLVEDGDLDDLPYRWQRAVLDQWLPRLYPEAHDAAARQQALVRDYQRLPELLVELDASVQVSGELGSLATKLSEEL